MPVLYELLKRNVCFIKKMKELNIYVESYQGTETERP